MSKRLCIVSTIALVVLPLALAEAARTSKSSKTGPPKVVSFTDDAKKLKAVVAPTEEQTKSFEEIKAERDKKLAEWDKASERTIESIKERMAGVTGKNAAATRKNLKATLDRTYASRQAIADVYERKMFALLTEEQRAKLNGQTLSDLVMKDLKRLKLEKDQQAKLLELCQRQGKLVALPVTQDSHPQVVKSIENQAYASIFTPEQRASYNKMTKPKKTKASSSSSKKSSSRRSRK